MSKSNKDVLNKKINYYFGKISEIIIYFIMVIIALSLCVPLIWMIINSFKGYIEFYQTKPFELGKCFSFENYVYAIEHLKVTLQTSKGRYTYYFTDMLFNSFIWAVGPSLVSIICSTMCAYVIAKYRFVGRNIIYTLGVIVMTLPVIGTFPSAMLLKKALGVYDNLFLTILTSVPAAFSGMAFLILYAAFKSIPWDYAEAVFIDGGGNLRVFTTIMVPLVLPTCAVLFVLSFIGNWNDYSTFLIWLPSYANIAFGMFYFQEYTATTGATTPSILAGFVIVAIPTSALYLLAQKLINAKFMVGGLKG